MANGQAGRREGGQAGARRVEGRKGTIYRGVLLVGGMAQRLLCTAAKRATRAGVGACRVREAGGRDGKGK